MSNKSWVSWKINHNCSPNPASTVKPPVTEATAVVVPPAEAEFPDEPDEDDAPAARKAYSEDADTWGGFHAP